MTLTDYNNKRSVLGIEGTGINTTTTKDRNWTNKTTKEVAFTIPAGSKVHVDFSPKMHPGSIFITIGDQVKISKTSFAHNWMKGIGKPPGIKTLEKWSNTGVSKSVTGQRVEADGYGPDGSPSWELVIGII